MITHSIHQMKIIFELQAPIWKGKDMFITLTHYDAALGLGTMISRIGPQWLSSGQRACLRWSEFESRWCLQFFFCKICVWKEQKRDRSWLIFTNSRLRMFTVARALEITANYFQFCFVPFSGSSCWLAGGRAYDFRYLHSVLYVFYLLSTAHFFFFVLQCCQSLLPKSSNSSTTLTVTSIAYSNAAAFRIAFFCFLSNRIVTQFTTHERWLYGELHLN